MPQANMVAPSALFKTVLGLVELQLIKRGGRGRARQSKLGEMKRETLLGYVVGLMLICCMAAAAQDKGNWRAASSPAKSITGDVGFTDEKVAINFSTFTIARIRGLQAAEA